MEGLVKGAIEGFINGFTTGALMFCASQAISVLSKAASSRCKVPDHCFIAGTLILTSLGNKKIEDIEVGDEVWAFNEETGDKTLKKVTQLFRKKKKKWVHLLFEFLDGTTEEIVCTEGHPFYVNNLGWIKSIDLLENDLVLLYNNCTASLIAKEIEELEVEETTYNFEVSDYHTYYVGENSFLVHNKCIFEELGIENYNQVGSKYTPDELINKLDDLGFSKEVTFKSASSGPATIMKRGNLTFRIQVAPANGNAYFRVMNSGGNYLSANGSVLSDVSKQAFRNLTHFYF